MTTGFIYVLYDGQKPIYVGRTQTLDRPGSHWRQYLTTGRARNLNLESCLRDMLLAGRSPEVFIVEVPDYCFAQEIESDYIYQMSLVNPDLTNRTQKFDSSTAKRRLQFSRWCRKNPVKAAKFLDMGPARYESWCVEYPPTRRERLDATARAAKRTRLIEPLLVPLH
ncbi:MAG: hypothetical protein KGJ13_09065 [Patescibacteria group bacterium]|nr:hypothetical protein [Patescibacteria group bacterium]